MRSILEIIGLFVAIDCTIGAVYCIYWAIRTHGFKE